MIPWSLVEAAAVPGGAFLRLMRRGDEFSIMLGGNELMNSRLGGSEAALARLSCRRLTGRTAPHVLIGGLGMGFTLRAALAEIEADARVTVAELVPAVVAWAEGPMAGLFGASLADPRVSVVVDDVGAVIEPARSAFDAILLDVDNGPEGLTSQGNSRLYGAAGLRAARRALRPRGVLAVWSASPDRSFSARLRQAGFAVEEVAVRATRNARGARHVIWLAAAAGPSPGRSAGGGA